MKDLRAEIVVASGVYAYLNVLLQPGWYQYVIFEHANEINVDSEYYKHGMALKKDSDMTKPHHGGAIFYEQLGVYIVTSGGGFNTTRYVYKLFNLEIKKPTYITILVVQTSAVSEICVIHFKYSEKKLLEVI